MTQPQTITVDQQEILNRADEVESPMATAPTGVPAAPCALTAAKNAAQQLVLSADNMRTYLAAGAKERQRLATSLRNAAQAYGEVDDDAATALSSDGDGTVEAESAGGAGGDSRAGLNDTPTVAAAGEPDFTDLKTAATKLESGDQGVSFADFADGWNSYNLALQGDLKRFREFDNWQGDAAAACAASLDQQREWILHMASLSAAMAKQAQYVAQLQVWARRSHPSLADVTKLEELSKDPAYKDQAIKLYAEYQAKSEQVLTDYTNKAALEPVNPPKPPAAVKIDPPAPPQQEGLIPGILMPPSDGSGEAPSGGAPSAPMMPPSAGTGGGMPAGAAGGLTAAGREAAAKMPGDLSVKAASLGGGIGGGVGGGVPATPPAPATGVVGESVRPAAAGDLGGMGQGKAPAGSGMGAGGGGMPMGAHGQGQGGSKTKGAQQDDEALYIEDRAWTEAVIGNRRRHDSKESK